MIYKDTHPRKVRGEAVHQTIEEKMKEKERIGQEFGEIPPEIVQKILDKKYVMADGRVVRGSQMRWHKDKETKDYEEAKKRFMGEHSELAREAIEATYLIP
ncbi:MAG: hypothetical protein ABH874_06870, partial [Methanobacteriota archaeon]